MAKSPIIEYKPTRSLNKTPQVARIASPTEAPPPKPPKLTAPKLARLIVGYEQQQRRCGCTDAFKLLKGERDDYKAGRLAKWQKKQCQRCARKEEQRIKEEAAARRRARPQALAHPKTPKFRLPHGSKFTMTYESLDEQNGSWHGVLHVPGLESFTDSYTAIHDLFVRLGLMWYNLAKRGNQVNGAKDE